MTTFGDLRSLAHRTPSRAHFQALLEALHATTTPPEQVAAEWLPYLEGALEGWPDDDRACGRELTKVLEREPVPWARLVRTLDYEHAQLTQGRVAALSQAEHLRHITRLDLRDLETRPTRARPLGRGRHEPSIGLLRALPLPELLSHARF